jgi:hypothetical protein
MSKKPARSERDVDLPDWADEVTPADEVMKKFYAPTGSFKSGPINVQQPAAPITDPSASPPLGDVKEGLVNNQPESEAVPGKPASTTSAPPSIAEQEDKREKSSLPLPGREIRSIPEEKTGATESAIQARPVVQASTETLERAQTSSFEEFARKWKRYLYPGQLAVMRTLFDLTIGRGTTECFTRYSEIAVATKMTRRNCINVMNSLVERGFVTRLEIRNDATGKGIKLRIHADPIL